MNKFYSFIKYCGCKCRSRYLIDTYFFLKLALSLNAVNSSRESINIINTGYLWIGEPRIEEIELFEAY